MTGAEATAIKAGEALTKQSVSRLWRWIRPDTSRTALIGKTDDLADAVERRERVLLDQLRGGKDTVIGDLEFPPSSDRSSLQAVLRHAQRNRPVFRGQKPAWSYLGVRVPGRPFWPFAFCSTNCNIAPQLETQNVAGNR